MYLLSVRYKRVRKEYSKRTTMYLFRALLRMFRLCWDRVRTCWHRVRGPSPPLTTPPQTPNPPPTPSLQPPPPPPTPPTPPPPTPLSRRHRRSKLNPDAPIFEPRGGSSGNYSRRLETNPVEEKLRQMAQTGQLPLGSLDGPAIEALQRLPVEEALHVLSDLPGYRRLRNASAYVMSLCAQNFWHAQKAPVPSFPPIVYQPYFPPPPFPAYPFPYFHRSS